MAGRLDRDVVLCSGPEPSLRWRAVLGELVDIARQLGVTEAFTVGGIPAMASHRRPISVLATGTDEAVVERAAGCHQDRQCRLCGASGAAHLLPGACQRARIATENGGLQLPNVNAQLQCIGRHHAAHLPRAQPCLNRAPFFGQVGVSTAATVAPGQLVHVLSDTAITRFSRDAGFVSISTNVGGGFTNVIRAAPDGTVWDFSRGGTSAGRNLRIGRQANGVRESADSGVTDVQSQGWDFDSTGHPWGAVQLGDGGVFVLRLD